MAGGGFRLEVQGLNKLTRSLAKAGVAVEDMKAANERVGGVVVRAAQPITPHDTGALAGSIRPARRRSGVIVRAGGVRGVRYAKFVEYGTKKMSARPYLRRAARESQPQWMDVYAVELQRLMDQVASSSDGSGN